MDIQGRIKDVRPARGRAPGSIILDDGEMFGCFDRDLLVLAKEQTGRVVDLSYDEKEKDGRTYRTIKAITPQSDVVLDAPASLGLDRSETEAPRYQAVTAVALPEPTELDKLNIAYRLATRRHELVLDLLRNRLVVGTHYVDGKMFGSAKPVLLQPGAYAILQALGYSAIPVIVAGPLEAPTDKNAKYTIVTRVDVFAADGRQIGAAFGSASSTIWSNRQLNFIGRAIDPDKTHNSTLKMSIKRSMVAAARQTTPAIELFAEDLEETGYTEAKIEAKSALKK